MAMFDPFAAVDYILWCYWKNSVPCVRCLRARMIKRWCHDSDYASNTHLQCYRCGWGWPVLFDVGLGESELRVFIPTLLQSVWAYGMTRDRSAFMEVMDHLDKNAKHPEHYRGAGTRWGWHLKKCRLYRLAAKVWEVSQERPVVDRMLEGRLERGIGVPEPEDELDVTILRPPHLRPKRQSQHGAGPGGSPR